MMKDYQAAASGNLIKLLAGWHMISTIGGEKGPSFDKLSKSVQIVPDDGLTRDRVLVGIVGGGYVGEASASSSAIAVVHADVRFAGLTLICASQYESMGYMDVREGGRLWLENCEMRKISPHDDFKIGVYGCSSSPEFAHGVCVGADSSCFVRGCVINGAGGAGIKISPRAARVVVESSTVTGCGGGSGVARATRMAASLAAHQVALAHQVEALPEPISKLYLPWRLPWHSAGECGVVEIEAWTLLHPNDTYDPDQRLVEVVLRECQIVGNLGPGVSVRSHGSESEISDGQPDVQDQEHQLFLRQYLDAVASRITLEGCVASGNGKEPGMLTSPVLGGGAVVWNQTKRGKRHAALELPRLIARYELAA
jgi:hypothetical protein